MIFHGMTVVNGFIFKYHGRPAHYLLMESEAAHIANLVATKVFTLEKAFLMFTGKAPENVSEIKLVADRKCLEF